MSARRWAAWTASIATILTAPHAAAAGRWTTATGRIHVYHASLAEAPPDEGLPPEDVFLEPVDDTSNSERVRVMGTMSDALRRLEGAEVVVDAYRPEHVTGEAAAPEVRIRPDAVLGVTGVVQSRSFGGDERFRLAFHGPLREAAYLPLSPASPAAREALRATNGLPTRVFGSLQVASDGRVRLVVARVAGRRGDASR